jgi:hypothetical protein
MEKKFRYSTVTDAVQTLRKAGFNKDCRLGRDFITCGSEKFEAKDLRIAVVYRYEGDSGPADEATVYGIKTKCRLKGILIMADGIYADAASTQILEKLHFRKNKILAASYMTIC